MKNKKTLAVIASVGALLLLLCGLLVLLLSGDSCKIVIEGDFADGSAVEYTGEKIQFPVAHVENAGGQIVSYGVGYTVINQADNSRLEDEYATFSLKTGSYQLVYTYLKDSKVSKTVSFVVQDTTSPKVEFIDVPNGLFLQNISEDTITKLPLYSIEDASTADGIDLVRTLKFKGAGDADFREYQYRQINNSYEIEGFGTFLYELTATDAYGNQTVASVQWKVKDKQWHPEQLPGDGILADYSVEGYCNLVEGGDANQYYKIGNDYSDEWLEEFKGAQGVLKLDLPFNNSAGVGNNTIRLRLPKTFTKKDMEGKYLAVRIYVEGEHLKKSFLFAGNNVEFRSEDATTRAFSTGVDGLETGAWKTYYIDAATVEHIGMYPNATYNPATTFYEGGDPADSIQLCFHREAGYYNDMVLYVDSISLAEKLPDTQITISGDRATWKAVEGAAGYRVDLNGQEQIMEETEVTLSGEKGFIRVTPLGNGATTLDGETVTAVYGLETGGKLACFDDPLYVDLFTDKLSFSTYAEHNGYKPGTLTGTLSDSGVTMDIGTGAWGVVTGVRFQFPNPQTRGGNTTLVMDMQVSNSDYDQIRVYDYAGKPLGNISLDESNTGKLHTFEIDISAYQGKLEGVQLIFGPNKKFSTVQDGVSVTFKEMRLINNYYPITVNGVNLMCAGTRELVPHFTAKNLVQFAGVYNFGVPADNTPLHFAGTVLLDGKKLDEKSVSVIGYPNTETICFNVIHGGKILTIMKDSVIYYKGNAIQVAQTFNARWNGSSWEMIGSIPAPPATEYITLSDGSQKIVENKVTLEAGYTANGVVQFLNVNDFGVAADDTPLGFEGTIMLDGQKLHSGSFVGYPQNTTIALKAPHQGKLLTILKGTVIYYGDKAVVVNQTFNQKWDGSSWQNVAQIPEVPEIQYVTLEDGTTRVLVGVVELNPGFTLEHLVQFTEVYDFGASEDSTPLGFQGTVLLQGKPVEDPSFTCHKNSTTIAIEKLNHKGKVLTVMEGALMYNDSAAVQVGKTFNALWDGNAWTAVAQIPEPPAKEYVTVNGEQKELVATVTLQPGYTQTDLVQFTNVYDFGLASELPLGFQGDVYLEGVELQSGDYRFDGYPSNTTIALKLITAKNHTNKVLTVQEGAILYCADVAIRIEQTFSMRWDGSSWTAAEMPEPGGSEETTQPEEPVSTTLSFQYRYGANNLIQVNTNLPANTPCKNFLTTDNGCNIDQSANQYQQIGWIAMDNVDGTIVLTFHFNSAFSAGQNYTLPAGAVFGFTDGSTYTLDKNYVFSFNGTDWTAEATDPSPEQPDPELPGDDEIGFQYRYGAEDLIQVNTNLPADIPCKNFLTTDNGCDIDESENLYQQIGWIGMDNVDGTIVLTFHFNSKFTAGQTYTLPAGAVFGFTDGSKYPLDKNYTFTFNGTEWVMEATEPEPELTLPVLTLSYRFGNSKLIQLNTNLPATTPCATFTPDQNGCSIDQSGADQQVNKIMMSKLNDSIILVFSFSSAFESGQTYVLPRGAVFGFTDGTSYVLDQDYTFQFNGSAWTLA